MQSTPSEKLAKIKHRIAQAAKMADRQPESVMLIGASKKQSAELIQQFALAGLDNVGENYLQEAIEKKNKLKTDRFEWHFIGQIQSNKTSLVSQHFNWVHGVDRLKIAKRLANPDTPLNILIQLNPDAQISKAGVSMNDAPVLCDQISQIEGVRLRGFMMIPAPRDSVREQRLVFASARKLLERVNQQFSLQMDHLSMGMSGDLEAAILEGSTMVRIGTDLFGART